MLLFINPKSFSKKFPSRTNLILSVLNLTLDDILKNQQVLKESRGK